MTGFINAIENIGEQLLDLGGNLLMASDGVGGILVYLAYYGTLGFIGYSLIKAVFSKKIKK